jgi:hypothetical protein
MRGVTWMHLDVRVLKQYRLQRLNGLIGFLGIRAEEEYSKVVRRSFER